MNKLLKRWVGGAALAGALGAATLGAFSPSDATAQSAGVVRAPEIAGSRWFNTGGKPLTLAGRRGKVTVVEFWTFGCSNCRVNLPAYSRWEKQFAAQGVEVIGIHTPETEAERDPKNVEKFLRQQNITYPVVTDENGTNWRRWHQQYWPTVYLVDKAGRVRNRYIGELHENEAKVERDIENLLQEPAP